MNKNLQKIFANQSADTKHFLGNIEVDVQNMAKDIQILNWIKYNNRRKTDS